MPPSFTSDGTKDGAILFLHVVVLIGISPSSIYLYIMGTGVSVCGLWLVLHIQVKYKAKGDHFELLPQAKRLYETIVSLAKLSTHLWVFAQIPVGESSVWLTRPLTV